MLVDRRSRSLLTVTPQPTFVAEEPILIIMETSDIRKENERPATRVWKAVKWAFVLVLAVTAGVIGYFAMFRTHPAQATVEKAFAMIENGDMEGFMQYVDPEGQLGRMWDENLQGARDSISSLLERYRLDFSSLSFATRAEGNAAEVELKGGRVTVYERGKDGPPAAFFDLGDAGLVLYVEKKDDQWLIEGVNYDIMEFLEGDGGFFP
jgi:hypothetical protein